MIARAWSTASVVLPNMLAVTSGLSSAASCTSVSTMPEIAPAALAKILRLMRLMPATSTTEGIIDTSLIPT